MGTFVGTNLETKRPRAKRTEKRLLTESKTKQTKFPKCHTTHDVKYGTHRPFRNAGHANKRVTWNCRVTSCWRHCIDSCRAMICHLPAMWFSIAPGAPRRGPGLQLQMLMCVCFSSKSLAALPKVCMAVEPPLVSRSLHRTWEPGCLKRSCEAAVPRVGPTCHLQTNHP